ncbi:MAG: hypothetical protein AABY22_02895 [Nanoarchaeota archaeon]
MSNNGSIVLTDREQWIVDELKKGTAVYVESKTLMLKFSTTFFPERKSKDKYGFGFITEIEKTTKDFQKSLRSLSKKKIIEKKAMGVQGAKTDFLLGRNWIWAWRLKQDTK